MGRMIRMKFKIYDTKNKLVKSTLFFLATLLMLSFNPLTVVASNNDSEEPIYIDLAEIGFTDIYLDIPEYYLEHLDIEYLEQNISFLSEYEFLELQADKIILEQIVLDDYHTLILLYEHEDTNDYVEITAVIVFTKVAIATFAAFKNPVVIKRLNSVVASVNMRTMTDARASAIRSSIRNQIFASNEALQDTVMRRMVESGMTPSQARAIGHGVSQLVRWR